ncbi:TPM domain-containing protein [Gordonia zhaorongruii]|uniref:TPM domain-containing protein n=1 Tax=Gordonia zhaorongruii TaxID=2597659 RepID=UPI00117E48F2|nr:TPM domain-containing protein [Gordonia zhaorongruii]
MSFAPARRLLAVLIALFIVLVGSLVSAGSVAAKAPFRLPTQVVDPAGVLDDRQTARVQGAVDDVDAAHQIQYWVVFVKNFDGMAPEEWTEQTVAQSDLGAHDAVLAIATDDRSYRLVTPFEIETLSDAELRSIIDDDLAPPLQQGRFSDAAVAVGDGLEQYGGEEKASRTGWIIGAIVVALIIAGGVFLYLRNRRRRDDAEALDNSLKDDSFTLDQLERQPLEVLDPWSREILTDTDRAIAISSDELALAIDEFGDDDTEPFTAAVENARDSLSNSFMLRQRLDDGLVTDPDEHREVLVEIITTCSAADAALDQQVEPFDEMRDLLRDSGNRLDALVTRTETIRERIPAVQDRLDELSADLGDNASRVADNVNLAGEHLQLAADSTDQGREAVQAGDRQGSVVGSIRTAESALDQAEKLLDAVEAAAAADGTHTGLPALLDKLQAAEDYIETRRGVVGALARTRLSEARRLADTAADQEATDPAASRDTAAHSADLADEALAAAQSDVAEWLDSQPTPPHSSFGDLGPVLTGILVDSVLNGSLHDGGYSHDGRSPASYGGSSSSGRIGVGGRF